METVPDYDSVGPTEEHTSRGVMQMLMRTDPFRELDRLTQQVFGTATRPAAMPMDAWRDGDEFIGCATDL